MKNVIMVFRKLPIACDNDVKTSFTEANGPNVTTENSDGAISFAVDSLRRSI